MRRRVFAQLALLVVLATAGLLSAAEPLRSTTDIHSLAIWNFREVHPLRLEGTLTWVDRERSLLVVQDAAGAVALQVPASQLNLTPGHRISIEASNCWPTLPNVPDFPLGASGHELLTSFEGPTNWGTTYIARVRGYVHPPVSGEYRFWIASDDTSELWLGADDNPATARAVAGVVTWTKSRELGHLPGQQSPAVFLEAGRRYYIEAVHEQRWAGDHLSVAWEGPGLPAQIIAGQNLSPWIEPAEGTVAPSGERGKILREYWFNRSVENASLLTAPRPLTSSLALAQPVFRDLGPGTFPSPQRVQPGATRTGESNFTWSEIEGTVEFLARHGDTLELELSAGGSSSRVVVQSWRGAALPRVGGRRIRLQGIGEAAFSNNAERVLGTVWVPEAASISVLEDSPRSGDVRRVGIAELQASEPNAFRGRAVKLRGRVVAQENGKLTLSDAGSFRGYVSGNGTDWKPLGAPVEIAMGATVEIGLVVNSRSTEKMATAVFDHLDGLPGVSTPTSIGGPTQPGSFNRRDGVVTVQGSGHDIWISPDQFYFVHGQLTGAGEITARISQFETSDPWAKGGLMIRESLAPDAQFVDLVQSGANGACFQWRKTADGSAPLSVNDSLLRAPHWLKLARRFAMIGVEGERAADFSIGKHVEVVGYVTAETGEISLADASIRELTEESEKPAASVQSRPLVELANVLGTSGNVDRYDLFKTRGVVTFAGEVAGRRYLAIQDQSGAAFVSSGANVAPQIRPRQFIEVHSNPGWTTPSSDLTASNLFVLGEGVLPPALHHPLEYSLPRRGEASWIELEGIVRSVSATGLIELRENNELFSVAVLGADSARLQREIDARVRVRGVIAFPGKDERLLLVPGIEHLEVVDPPAAQPFAQPARGISDLVATARPDRSLHRAKISGLVTFARPGLLYLQDSTGGARVELASTETAQPGDEVEAVGFPEAAEDRSLVLSGALFRSLRTRIPPPAVTARAEEILSGQLGGRLVRIEAVASRVRINESDATIELQLDQRIFRASLDGPTKNLPTIPPGSVVSITGVCVLETALPEWIKVSAGTASILPARLLLRSAEDLVVLQKPRAWAVKRTLLAISALIAVLVVAFIWIHNLRRRVAQRTAELKAAMEKLQRETQTAATLAERNRLAGEIHDSLEQGFSGLILQLDTTAKHSQSPAEVRSGLTLARNMVAFSRNEVRHAVWDLQSPVLEDSDLGTALKKIAGQLAPDALQITFSVEGQPRPLSSTTEHHLLRIAQEAIANCVKHAGAKNLHLALVYSEPEVVLSVRDDGCGFVPAEVLTGGLGHFGLRSLRGRASKIQSTLRVVSAPGAGTLIEVRVATPAVSTP